MTAASTSALPMRPALNRKRTSDQSDDGSDTSSVDAPTDSRSKPRARINMACLHCRHRKIKCDGAQPSCATCVRLRRECDYEPVTEYENLMSRERKHRNKEKKQQRLSNLAVYSGHSPLSMLHPGGYALPTAPTRHYFSMPGIYPAHAMVNSRAMPEVAASLGRPRSKTMADYPQQPFFADDRYLFAASSSSQPQTPDAGEALQFSFMSARPSGLQTSVSLDDNLVGASASYPNNTFDGYFPPLSDESNVHLIASPASASRAEFDIMSVRTASFNMAVPTSAHVRPVDLPAPHGHFDFASVPFPTQQSFASEIPASSLRRRSSVQAQPYDYSYDLRRPSVAEIATTSLVQRVADKRAEKPLSQMGQAAQMFSVPSFMSTAETNGWAATTNQLWSESFSLPEPHSNASPSADSPSIALTMPEHAQDFATIDSHIGIGYNGTSTLDAAGMSAYPDMSGLAGQQLSCDEGYALSSHPHTHGSQATACYNLEGGSAFSGSSTSSANGEGSRLLTEATQRASSQAWSPCSEGTAVSSPSTAYLPQEGWARLEKGAPLLSPVSDLQVSFNALGSFSSPRMTDSPTSKVRNLESDFFYGSQC